MKRVIRSTLTTLLAFTLLCASTGICAARQENSAREQYVSSFQEYLRGYLADFYEGEGSYQILGFGGQDITQSFYNNTAGFYAQDDMTSLFSYFEGHVLETSKDVVQSEPMMLSDGDLAKNITREKTELCTTSGRSDRFYITYQVGITFFYSPNTFLISNVGTTQFHCTPQWGDAWDVHISQILATPQVNGVNLTVSKYFNVTADFYGTTYDFGRHGCTFTVNGESPSSGTL